MSFNKYTIPQLKIIVLENYIHDKIPTHSRMKKKLLIKEIEKYLMIENGIIIIKSNVINYL